MFDQIADIFESDRTSGFTLSADEEAELIVQAQTGDEAATMGLVRAYAPALRSAVARHARVGVDAREGSTFSTDDARSVALVGLLDLIQTHDADRSPRLAGRVSARLAEEFGEAYADDMAWRIPTRSLKRFYGILALYDYDEVEAEAHAHEHAMRSETFREIYAAVRGTGSLDAPADEGAPVVHSPIHTPSPVVDVEDKILVEFAFRAVSEDEAEVCRYAYGFATGEPLTDAGIVHAISEARLGAERVAGGETAVSRPAVQRRRAKGLGKMRTALGVTVEGA